MNKSIKDFCFQEAFDRPVGNVGINFNEGKIEVIMPRCYNLSLDDNSIRNDILILINTLNKYKNRIDSNAYIENKEFFLDGLGESIPIKNIFWLLEDYMTNGIFKETIFNCKKEKHGKIYWNKTIKSMPVYYSNDNFIYLDFVIKNKSYNENYLLTIIHQFCIYQCINYFGWLYNSISPLDKPVFNMTLSECLNFLYSELLKTNSDYKRSLINNMIEFFQGSSTNFSDKSFKNFSISSFNNVWEDMLRVIFGNEDEKDYYVRAKWNLCCNNATFFCNYLRPDIILKDNENIYVIDAKYFKYGLTFQEKDLPNSSDISKQFNYSYYIAKKYNIEENLVQDVFLMPFNSKGGDIFKYIGFSTIDNYDRRIYAILVDIKTVMKLYTNKNNYDEYKVKLLGLLRNIKNNS